ncbi:MAG: hypothetical protein LBB45_07345 [Methanobrevibacter sp.]|jgi:hypothetical protein|nr:hypothetical protein [Candidatus Methanovirga basalitermitum]
MTKDIEVNAQKKLKSRVRKFKKVLKDDDEKEKFFDTLGASVEVFLPSKKPEEGDSIILYTTAEGKIVDGEYSYLESENEHISLTISDKDLELFIQVFKDFKLE